MFQHGFHRRRQVRRRHSVLRWAALLLALLSLCSPAAAQSQPASTAADGTASETGATGGEGESGLPETTGGAGSDGGGAGGHSGDGGNSSGSSGGSGGDGGALGGVFELPNPPSRFNPSAAWHHMRYRTPNACWSQQERHLYHTADRSHPSQAFVDAVVAYEAMQEECVSQEGVEQWQWVRDKHNWGTEVPRYGPERKPCRYIIIHDLVRGVGNRIASYVISFVLGLLTDRAIIAPPKGFLTRRFCNPFARGNTSWTVHPDVYELLLASALPLPRLRLSAMAKQLRLAGVEGKVDAGRADLERQVERNGSVWMDLHYRTINDFCDLLWTAADLAPFWFASIDAYCLPSFYYIPHFADRLHELFPDRRVFTHVARFLLHPDNHLWAKITYTFLANLAHFPHRLGLQIRSPDGIDLKLASRILQCAVQVRYLPPTQPYPDDPSMALPTLGNSTGGGAESTYRSFRTMGVFVSSLSIRHMLDLETHYVQQLPLTNTFVTFCSLTNEGRENWREQQQIDAVMDMWILSFSDRLLITHISSFGRTALGLAGVDAYSMQITVIKMRSVDWRNMTGPVCERVSSEPCDTMGVPVIQSGCRWDFNRSGLVHGQQRPPGFGFCPGMVFGVQDLNPLLHPLTQQ
ncbi:hypothetical protein CLOP_g15399 [Closterium sp. NIES-67]|nr:hypothetical protein CLOP_g11516 [Closterium sp. NIES-67]GJP85286.1 hypothetical protein CLOP_g15399 [Closterium sp. NIES-67]